MSPEPQMVTVTIDGIQVRVPKGTNLIEVAKRAGLEIPYYCYHPDLSVAGNCRMCQVKVEGMPKLTIGCNTGAMDGMVVMTQRTSEEVADAQRATLEFLLINHPLDCTVCDQAGHCKLQDYYYEYNGKGSRFTEAKVEKVKAEEFGPEVIYDGERCILCTRCVRFCDEISETSELGVFNRGDKSVIGVHEGTELDNPLSASVVDLCPVGALTHRRWRFNSRIWYTESAESICTGCSTGCNATAFMRDNQVVQVKARRNEAVNQEWMCDEGRYGFMRFQPEERLSTCLVREEEEFLELPSEQAVEKAKGLLGEPEKTALFLSPFLMLEELWMAAQFAEEGLGLSSGSGQIAIQLVRRELTQTQARLISPDFAPNARAGEILGFYSVGSCSGGEDGGEKDWRASCEAAYQGLLSRVRAGEIKRILLVGDHAIRTQDIGGEVQRALYGADCSVAITCQDISSALNGTSRGAHEYCQVLLPGRTVNEKNGVMLNRDGRFQQVSRLLTAPAGTSEDWVFLNKLASACNSPVLPVESFDIREVFRAMKAKSAGFDTLNLTQMGESGVPWMDFSST